MDKVPKNKIVSVHFSCALFSLLDFLALEDRTNRLSQNVGKELLLYAVQYFRYHMIMWQCGPWFGSTWSGSERSGLMLHEQI